MIWNKFIGRYGPEQGLEQGFAGIFTQICDSTSQAYLIFFFRIDRHCVPVIYCVHIVGNKFEMEFEQNCESDHHAQSQKKEEAGGDGFNDKELSGVRKIKAYSWENVDV